MRTVTFDAGFLWDDPNLRWGEPAYLLEPGDPGYVAPLTNNPEPPTKTKRMKRNTYFPSRQAEQILWLSNYANKLPGYTTTLGLTAGQVTAIVADCNWLIYVLQTWLPTVRNWALAGTDAVTEAQTGTGAAALVLPVFTAPALPTGVVSVNPGALNRIFALAQIIKDSGKSTEAINTNLGLIGSAQTAPDVATLKPVISVSISGTLVNVKWGWGGNGSFLDSCEILVDRGAGFVLLTIDTTPNYTDTQPFPAAGQSALWKYKAIYRQGDQRVGQWSDVVSVAVAG